MLLGCGGSDPKDTGATDTGATDTGATDSGAESGGDSGGDSDSGAVAPWITDVVDVHCEGEVDDETWYDTIRVDDPQGAGTVIDGWLYVRDDTGAELAKYGLNCDDGACDGYFRAEYDGISCAMGPTLLFVFTVEDLDGNWSELYSWSGG